MNEYALQTIEASKSPPSLISRVLPFSLFSGIPTKEVAVEIFLISMDNIHNHLVNLREEAEISMDHLMRLEEHLKVLHEIVARDDGDLRWERDKVLSSLWTKLGGNRNKKRRIRNNLNILGSVDSYRRKALAHVVATLEILRVLDAGIEDLRIRVATPNIVGDKIPLEVQIKSIKAGVDRLKEVQTVASLKQGQKLNRMLEIGA